MSKVDYTRDYYADLELSGRTDDIDLIKKQYRKLCMLVLALLSDSELTNFLV